VIAILETLISAKIATKDTRVPYDSQREIYGLGITNILS
jgi:MFS superfamily sulfate permease-like transporter